MKKILSKIISIWVLCIASAYSQSQFHVLGNLHIHTDAQLAFHTDLINNGNFNKNLGKVFFYNSNRSLTISGGNTPVFYDMISHVPQDLELQVSVGVTNFMEFSSGRVLTPRNDRSVYLNFEADAPYMGVDDDRHVDGYVGNEGMLDFTFPIGDENRFRPMRIDPLASQDNVLGAYFFEDPNTPSSFYFSFNRSNFEPSIAVVSSTEFWDLDGTIQTKVTLSWGSDSNISFLANDLKDLRVVGWSILEQKWINLGNVSYIGNLDAGELTSELILPNDYEILTIGSVLKNGEEIFVYSGMSPNNDGVNDTFLIQGIESNPDNELFIYNRWGVQVYYKKGYDNSWGGVSEGRITFGSDRALPVGTYYYMLKLKGKSDQFGYFYIQR